MGIITSKVKMTLNKTCCYHSVYLLITSRLPGFARSLGREGGRAGGEGRGGEGRGGEGRGGEGGGREEGRGGRRDGPVLPHCLLYFLKLCNVFNDNVQSIR